MERPCCHCNKWVRVMFISALSGSRFRLGFLGGNHAYSISKVPIAPTLGGSPPVQGATPVLVSVFGNFESVSIPANARRMSDWISMPVGRRGSALRHRALSRVSNAGAHQPAMTGLFFVSLIGKAKTHHARACLPVRFTGAAPTTTLGGLRAPRTAGSPQAPARGRPKGKPLRTATTTPISWKCGDPGALREGTLVLRAAS